MSDPSKALCGRVVVKYFPWSVVEANGDTCQVLGAMVIRSSSDKYRVEMTAGCSRTMGMAA
jgi:hypothetical protein